MVGGKRSSCRPPQLVICLNWFSSTLVWRHSRQEKADWYGKKYANSLQTCKDGPVGGGGGGGADQYTALAVAYSLNSRRLKQSLAGRQRRQEHISCHRRHALPEQIVRLGRGSETRISLVTSRTQICWI